MSATPRAVPSRRAARRSERLGVLNEIARIATLDLELRPMLQRITDALQRNYDWPFVACISVDLEHGVFVCEALSSLLPSDIQIGYTRPLGSGVVGEVAANGRPILLDDVRLAPNYVETLPGALSELCVPVRHAGRTVAILNLESTGLGEFHDQLPLLETVAEQLAGAIASAHLFEEVKRRARLLEVVAEVSRVALDAGELDLLLDRVAGYVHERFGLEFVALILIDEARREFELAAFACRGPLPVVRGKRWPVSSGLIGRAARTGEEQLVLDTGLDPDYVGIVPGVAAELVMPIRFRDQLLGLMDLESTSPQAFSAEDLLAFRTIAAQLAGAIHLAAVNRALEAANEHLQQANRHLERLSAIDGLTGIANRRRFEAAFDAEWRRAGRSGTPLSVVMVDLDHFKAFNDTYGHQGGDDCLRRVATVLARGLERAGDLVARYGGEEFIVILAAAGAAAAARTAEHLRAEVERLGIPHAGSPSGVVTVSLGVATARRAQGRRGISPEALLAAADRALYEAKRAGRNRVISGEL